MEIINVDTQRRAGDRARRAEDIEGDEATRAEDVTGVPEIDRHREPGVVTGQLEEVHAEASPQSRIEWREEAHVVPGGRLAVRAGRAAGIAVDGAHGISFLADRVRVREAPSVVVHGVDPQPVGAGHQASALVVGAERPRLLQADQPTILRPVVGRRVDPVVIDEHVGWETSRVLLRHPAASIGSAHHQVLVGWLRPVAGVDGIHGQLREEHVGAANE